MPASGIAPRLFPSSARFSSSPITSLRRRSVHFQRFNILAFRIRKSSRRRPSSLIGLLNLLGPKHTGGLAFLISVPTAIVVITLGLFSLPHLGVAIGHLQPLHGSFWQNWGGFVGIVLALSGVEAIANATGVMRLDPGSTDANPSVTKTSTPALLWVMVEVCFFTALLGLAMNALGGLQIVERRRERARRRGRARLHAALHGRNVCRRRTRTRHRTRLRFRGQHHLRFPSPFGRQHRDRRSHHDPVPHGARP